MLSNYSNTNFIIIIIIIINGIMNVIGYFNNIINAPIKKKKQHNKCILNFVFFYQFMTYLYFIMKFIISVQSFYKVYAAGRGLNLVRM